MTAEFVLADITALKATPPIELIDGVLRAVKKDAALKPAWFMYSTESTDTPNNDSVVVINSNPSTGRFLKLASGGSGELVYSWILTTPTFNQIAYFDILFLAMSESQYTDSTGINLYDSRIATFETNTDYIPGETIDLSNLVEENGPGLYFFVYKLQDNSSWENVSPVYTFGTTSPKGAIRFVGEKSLSIIHSNEETSYNVQANTPLVVIQSFANVTFKMEQFIIG